MTRRPITGRRAGGVAVSAAGTAGTRRPSGVGFDWFARAACVHADPELFVGDQRGGPEAFGICARCPVVAPCREFARRNGENYGVWGGSLRG